MPNENKMNTESDKEENKEQTVLATDSIKTNNFWALHKYSWWIIRETLVIVCALLIMGFGFIGWKISQGPIPLNFITPHLEKEFNSRFPNLKSSLGGTSLVWQKDTMSLNLRAENIELYEHSSPLMVISSTDIGLSIRQLIIGKLRVESLSFTGLAFRIHKDKAGKYSLVLGHKGEKSTELTLPLSQVNETPELSNSGVLEVFSHLKRVSFKNTDIVFEDLSKNKIWHSASINAFLVRGKNSITGSIKSTLFLNNDKTIKTKLNNNISYDTSTHKLQITTFFTELNPTDLSEKFPEYPELTMLNLPLSGKINFYLDEIFFPQKIEAEIYSPEGKITINDVYKEPINIREFKTSFSFIKQDQTITLEELSLDFEEKSHVHVTGSTSLPTTTNTETNFVIDAELTSFPVKLLKQYWPERLAPPSRYWVTKNIQKGIADKATLSIAGILLKDKDKKINLKKLSHISGDIDFHDASVKYLGKMPPIIGAKGRARYTKTDFNIIATDGKLKDISVTSGDIRISGLGTKPKIDIKVKANGPLKTVLFTIDQEPLKYARLFGLDINNVSGESSGDLTLSFPLKKGMSVKDIKINVDTTLTKVSIPNIIKEYDITGGPLAVKLNNDGMSINGNGKLDKAPISFKWYNSFNKKDEILHRINGNINIPTNMLMDLTSIKSDILKIQTPNIPTNFTYTQLQNSKRSKLFLSANLKDTKILIPPISYNKTNTSKGSISMFIHMDKHKTPYKISSLLLNLPNLNAEGSVNLSKDSKDNIKVTKANIKNFKMYDTRLSAKIDLIKNKTLRIKVKGPYIDISSFSKKKKGGAFATKTKNMPFEIMIEAGRLSLAKGENIDEVKLFISKTEWGNTDKLEIDGVTGKGKIYFRYLPKGTGHSLHFEAEDAGAALAALGITKTVRGGTIVIKGEPVKGGSPYDVAGRAILSNFTVVKLPALARLLNALSPVGLQSLLSGEGIYFTYMKTNFAWKKRFFKNTQNIKSEIITVRKGKTSGSSLGLTFDGSIDQTLDTIDISGTIVPISGVNKAISGIPIIGDILSGGSDAVFAATYSIKGPKKEAAVTVNPLATLAPGFLRKIFFE